MNDDDYDRSNGRREDARELPHSGPGIASFVLGLLNVVGALVLISAAAVVAALEEQGAFQENEVRDVILGVFVCGFLGLVLLGLILGVAGAVQACRKKVFAVLGIGCNALVLLGTVGLIVLGLLFGD